MLFLTCLCTKFRSNPKTYCEKEIFTKYKFLKSYAYTSPLFREPNISHSQSLKIDLLFHLIFIPTLVCPIFLISSFCLVYLFFKFLYFFFLWKDVFWLFSFLVLFSFLFLFFLFFVIFLLLVFTFFSKLRFVCFVYLRTYVATSNIYITILIFS